MADNLSSAWSSMKVITGISNSDLDLANALNFFSRFDAYDFRTEIKELNHKLSDQNHFIIEETNVKKTFSSINPNKSYGPDNICGRLLCSKELCPHFFFYIFNKPLKMQDAEVVPLP